MKQIKADSNLVAYCGLYCGACKSYLKDRCPGCHENEKAKWCKVRSCCRTKGYQSCAECKEYQDALDCGLFNNIIAKLFGLVFRSDRSACIGQIKEIGIQGHAVKMAQMKQQTIRK